MSKYTRRLGAPFVLASVILISACSSDAKKGPDSTALGADTTLNKDLALAGRDTTKQPQLKDVPPTPAANAPSRPVAKQPARTPPRTPPATTPAPKPSVPATTAGGNVVTTTPAGAASGGGAVGSIPAGSTLNTHASSKVCTNTNTVGDHVTATIDNSVSGSNGAMIPAGATLNLTVTRLKRSENSNDPVVLEFAVNSVTFGGHTYPVDANVTSANVTRVRDQPKSKDIQKVGIGAVAGAIAGKILGKSTKGAVIGGAAGAAAGAAAAAATANYQGCIDAGSSIVVTLTSPTTVKA
ncbi:MAG: hypothetical protein ABJF01_19545 [bacterium]